MGQELRSQKRCAPRGCRVREKNVQLVNHILHHRRLLFVVEVGEPQHDPRTTNKPALDKM